MEIKEIIGQIFGIIGLFIFVVSFQCKNSNKLVFVQGIGGLMFFINFLLIEAYGGALFNVTVLIRGLLYLKKDGKLWKPVLVEVLFTLAYVYSLMLVKGDVLQIVLTTLPYLSLMISKRIWYIRDNFQTCIAFFHSNQSTLVARVLIFYFTAGKQIDNLLQLVYNRV